MNKIYTGIGSRSTPPKYLDEIRKIAEVLSNKDWILRSGGAEGADTAFEEGVECTCGAYFKKDCDCKEVYLPWKNFNKNKSTFFDVSEEALKMAEKYHPAWKYLSRGARLLHARNCYQVLGMKLNKPSDIIICYTKDGAGKGGTGQALRIAKDYNIPIIDLGGKTSESESLLNEILNE
jgi:hypothetical protein